MVRSNFDPIATSFDRHRALPDGVPLALRAAILKAIGSTRPRLLDLGAGTGRIGRTFVAAGDDYVGVDRSWGMLKEFLRNTGMGDSGKPQLVLADGGRLPFPDATFDAAMLIRVFGGMRDWRRLLGETRRVMRQSAVLFLGRAVAPADGVDALMRQQLDLLLAQMGVRLVGCNTREQAQRWIEAAAQCSSRLSVAAWHTQRTPRGFLDRHATGAQFSSLPPAVKGATMKQLGTWAAEAFGSIDAPFAERHEFELHIFQFNNASGQ
jgi:ubiquinone/menaquinone biosynthesis C-methylase UbiE